LSRLGLAVSFISESPLVNHAATAGTISSAPFTAIQLAVQIVITIPMEAALTAIIPPIIITFITVDRITTTILTDIMGKPEMISKKFFNVLVQQEKNKSRDIFSFNLLTKEILRQI